MTYCLPVRPIVTTTINEAVPITIPSAVRAKRHLLLRKESSASVTISLKSIVLRAVSTSGRPVIGLLYVSCSLDAGYRRLASLFLIPTLSLPRGREPFHTQELSGTYKPQS